MTDNLFLALDLSIPIIFFAKVIFKRLHFIMCRKSSPALSGTGNLALDNITWGVGNAITYYTYVVNIGKRTK